MLDGRRRAEGGRKAGLTSSPDFLRTIGDFGSGSSRSLSSGELVRASSCFRVIEFSTNDREWATMRLSFAREERTGFPAQVAPLSPLDVEGILGCLSGDEARFCSIDLTAASNSSS